MANEITQYNMNDMERLAMAIVKSKMFGIQQPEQALALMAIAQAEGLHPAIAARDYHIVNGRPTLKADAMMARFQAAGGKVEWNEYSDEKCEATFTHPQGGTVKVMWDMARVKKAEISNAAMYKKYPRNMLRARVISEGIRTIFPGVLVGTYTPEEAQEFEAPRHVAAPVHEIIENKPVELMVKSSELIDRIKEFTDAIGRCTNKNAITSLVARNTKLLLWIKDQSQEHYESLMAYVATHSEAFDMAEAAE